MHSLNQDVDTLARHTIDLERRRESSPFANDVYEATTYWLHLGEWVLANNTKVNFPERAREELTFLEQLRKLLQQRPPEEQTRYAPVFEIAEGILKAVEAVEPPKDGHLGVLRIIRKHFGFVQTDYGFAIVKEEPMGIRFSSGAVYLDLEYGHDSPLSYTFGPESEPKKSLWIEDLLFMYGDQRYRTLPDDLNLNTEADVERWFTFVASVFKQYGHDVLSNQPGIFEKLAKAQAERDREYTQKMDRLYGRQS